MKLKHKIFAGLLAVILTFNQTGAVFAADVLSQPETVSENIASENTDSILLDDSETEPDPKIEPVGIVSDGSIMTEELPYGLKGMPKGYAISGKQLEVKKELAAHKVVETIDSMKAGVDYVEDEVFFSCDDPEYAKLVAEAYNGTLASCKYGIAVIKLDPARLTVKEAVKAGADVMNKLPPVEVNYITKIDDPVSMTVDPASDVSPVGETPAADKKVIDMPDWSYWKNPQRFTDPALDPDYSALDPSDGVEKNMYQWMHDAINTYAAWGVTQGDGVTVAVIDGGVYAEHEDLKGQVVETKNVTDFEPVDTNGHGTHVAGIIAESANGIGGVGVAPKAKILSLPIFNEKGQCSSADEARAIHYAAYGDDGEVHARVINMSLGGPGYNATVQEEISNARKRGVITCIAMGNEQSNNVSFPAACDDAVAVCSIDESWQKSDFSTYGEWADIAAPGTAIYSTWNGYNEENATVDSDYYVSWDGTSMACPVVAGVCALYISAAQAAGMDPTADEVEAALKKSATRISSSYKIGAGVVNASAMLKTLERKGKPSILVPSPLSSGSQVTFGDNGETGGTLGYIYTVNGRKPSVSSGDVKEGFYVEAVNGSVTLTVEDLMNKGLELNTASKLMVGRITGLGTLTEIAEERITVKGDASNGMEILGTDYIGKGKGVTYTLNRKLPRNAVTWSLEGAPAGVTINKDNGRVTTRNTSIGEFTVVARTEGGKATKPVKLVDPAASVTLKAEGTDKTVNMPVTDRNGNIKSARLFNVDILKTEELTENVLQLTGTVNGRSEQTDDVEYISSQNSIATVDAAGKVTAHKAGNVRITCRAKDGSNKQAIVNIKIIVPVSKLDMYAVNEQQCVAFGKSIKFKPAIGAAYGKPTISKIVWNKEPVKVMGYSQEDNTWTDLTSDVNSRKLIRINNGTVTVNKKIAELGPKIFKCTIKISATDGSGQTFEKDFYVTQPTTYIRYLTYSEYTGGDYILYFESDGMLAPIVTTANLKGGSATLLDYKDGKASVLVVRKRDKYEGFIGTGTSTITLKASDGTNVKTSVRVRWSNNVNF